MEPCLKPRRLTEPLSLKPFFVAFQYAVSEILVAVLGIETKTLQ